MSAKDFMSESLQNLTSSGISQLNSAVLKEAGAKLQSATSGIANARDAILSRGAGIVSEANAFTHDTSNSAPSMSDKVSLAFQPNILDNYDTYTYHWKLFITSTEDARAGTVLDSSKQTIIAESGVSDLTIDKIEFDAVACLSVEAGTGTQTTLKFQIVEPSGAGLLDKIYYESVSLGIGSWVVMPVFLQLEFRGRNPTTAESIPGGSPGPLSGLKWVWPLKLTRVKANVTNVGTRYDFEAIKYGEVTQSNSYFSIQHNVVLTGLTTFGSAMAALKKKLAEDQDTQKINNRETVDVYNIIVDPELEGVPLLTRNVDTSRGSDYIQFDKKVASYNAGTSIDKIVDSLLGSSSAFQEKIQSSATSTSQPKAANDAPAMKQLWRIITEAKPIKFDNIAQLDAIEHTIYIVKYQLGTVDASSSQTGGTPETIPASKKRIATYSKKRILRKKYNYIFTGLNDQIINFDLNMNFAFASANSRISGLYYDTAIDDTGVSKQDRIEAEKNAALMVTETMKWVNSAQPNQNVSAKIFEAQESLKNISNLGKVTTDKFTNLLNKFKPGDRVLFAQDLISQQTNNLPTAALQATSLATPITSNLKFVSDINVSSSTEQEAVAIAQSNKKGKLRPVAFRTGPFENNLAYGIDPASTAARSRTSSIFSTALYTDGDANLVKIKITIKGDPYWLFPRSLDPSTTVLPYKSNMSSEEAIRLIKNGHIDNPDSVNLYGTDNFIIIRFRTPKTFNATTGVIEPFTDVEMFSGVYKITRVASKFEMGKFSQELECILDNMIDLSDIREFINAVEESSKQQDKTIDALDSSSIVIPDTAIKGQKILGALDQINGQVASIKDNIMGQALSIKSNTIGTINNAITSNIPSLPNLTASDILSRIPPIG